MRKLAITSYVFSPNLNQVFGIANDELEFLFSSVRRKMDLSRR